MDFQFNHTRYRKRSPENSRSGSLAYEAILRQRVAKGEPIDRDPKAQDVAFHQFAWRWFDEYVVSNNKYSEQRTKRTVLRSALIPFFGKTPVGEVTAHKIEQYKAQALKKGLSRKTINNHLTIFRKCVCTAYDWLALPGAPPKVTWLKCPPSAADYLSPDECSLLLSHARGPGMLVAEALELRERPVVADDDFRRDVLTFRANALSDATCLLTIAVAAAVDRFDDNVPVHADGRSHGPAAGSPFAMRHTARRR